MRIAALIRGRAKAKELTTALDQLGVKPGENFLIVHPDALDVRASRGECICGRPLSSTPGQDELFPTT